MTDDTARRHPGHSAFMAIATAALILLGTGPASAATVTVASVNFVFQPASQTVSVGDIVRWTFAGDPHTVTSGAPGAPDGRFDSGIKDPGGTFQVTFNNAGTFRYFCQIHSEQMFGTIVVRAVATPAPTAKASPSPKPTAKPTARPTTRPTAAPTAAPSKAATAAPTPAPTTSPAAAATATTSPAAAATATAKSASPSPGQAGSASPLPSTGASAAPTVDGGIAAGSPDLVPIVAIAIVVGLLAAGGLALARRPRAG